MKRVAFITCFLVFANFLFASPCVSESSNLFGMDLYALLSQESGNAFVSPFSISSALAMTYIGAVGNTAQQMRQVLHFDLADQELHSGFSRLIRSMNEPKKDYQLSVVNAIWAQEGYAFKEDFLQQIEAYYQAGFNLVDFINDRTNARKTINDWIEENTEGKIKNMIKENNINALTRLILTNAIYFKGSWQKPFDPSATELRPFYVSRDTEKEVQMMWQRSDFRYTDDDLVQVLELPYSGSGVSMIVILPKEERTLHEVEQQLSLELFKRWISNLKMESVEVYLPKFRIECRLELRTVLMNMGMSDAFTDAADFSGMDGTKKLKIQNVIHQSFVEVDEKGTEAAAATAVIVGIKASPYGEKYVVFKADRPFLFILYDKTHDLILFMGRLSNPE